MPALLQILSVTGPILERAAPGACAIGLGLAGAGRPEQRAAFLGQNPGYGWVALETDASALLRGAHGERPGLVVAAGTGSVAAVRLPDGSVRLCGGWGFPLGDEGSGAWLGAQAVRHVQACLDGREIETPGGLMARVQAEIGPGIDAVFQWCARQGATGFATLAPLVFHAAEAGDPAASGLLQAAADALARLEQTLQPPGAPLPVVVAGSIGTRVWQRWPAAVKSRCVTPLGDGADGALRLIQAALASDALGSARVTPE